jgi:hypothetical protein
MKSRRALLGCLFAGCAGAPDPHGFPATPDPHVVHFTSERPLAGRLQHEARAASGDLRFELADSDADPERYRRLTGTDGSLATCLVAAGDVPLGAWVIWSDANELAERVQEARALAPQIVAAQADGAGEALAALYARTGSDALAARHSRAYAARYEALHGRTDRARALLSPSTDPQSANLTLAIVMTKELRAAEALPLLAQPAGQDEDLRLLTLADALHQTGDGTRALRLLEQLQRDHPHSRWRAAAQEQIDHLRSPSHGHKH